jgi:hypothetical protein
MHACIHAFALSPEHIAHLQAVRSDSGSPSSHAHTFEHCSHDDHGPVKRSSCPLPCNLAKLAEKTGANKVQPAHGVCREPIRIITQLSEPERVARMRLLLFPSATLPALARHLANSPSTLHTLLSNAALHNAALHNAARYGHHGHASRGPSIRCSIGTVRQDLRCTDDRHHRQHQPSAGARLR